VAFPAVIDTREVVEETLRRIDQGSRRIALVGAPSSGKTTALAGVATRLASAGWSTFRTSMPSGDDAGPLALTLLADQVGSGEVIRNSATTWASKVDATVAATRARAQMSPVLVTLDDPLFEQPGMLPTPFTEHATSLIGALSGIDNVAFIVARHARYPRAGANLSSSRSRPPPAASSLPSMVARSRAQRNRSRSLASIGLPSRSPAEVRLLVAIEKSQHQGKATHALR
jgi:hypothetical protein